MNDTTRDILLLAAVLGIGYFFFKEYKTTNRLSTSRPAKNFPDKSPIASSTTNGATAAQTTILTGGPSPDGSN